MLALAMKLGSLIITSMYIYYDILFTTKQKSFDSVTQDKFRYMLWDFMF